ncbi:MAG: DUF3750 domain-containing protein [Gammaproteobacteria bacterium]|nr:DUF3750 domain-containing protein [Gammaproteobacteria bacterium]
MKKLFRLFIRIVVIIGVFFFMPVGCMLAAHHTGTSAAWWELRRDSSDQAPDASTGDAIIQVYAARAARWRGAIGVHTWIATKRSSENYYTRFEVLGYALRWTDSAVRIRRGSPDAYWYGNRPTLLREIRGDDQVDEMIDRLYAASTNYPYADKYQVWPGPNSNTYIAWLAHHIPELQLELPTTAVGKDYLPFGRVAAITPSHMGGQLSFGGYAGLLASLEEGVEVNLFGLSAGVDMWPPAIKLPGVGRIGMDDVRRKEYYSIQ